MPTLNIDLNYVEHPKTRRLVGLLGEISRAFPIWLWLYIAKYKPDTGDISDHSVAEIESIVGWSGEPGLAVSAMVKVGFLDRIGDGFAAHDWADHQGHISRYREKARKMSEARWQDKNENKKLPISTNDATSIPSSNATSIPSSNPSAVLRSATQGTARQGDATQGDAKKHIPASPDFAGVPENHSAVNNHNSDCEAVNAAPIDPKPKTVPKPKKQPTGPHAELIRYWVEKWEERHKPEKYPFRTIDAVKIQELLKACGNDPPKARGVVDRFLATDETFYRGHAVAQLMCASILPRFLVGSRPVRHNNAGVAVRQDN